jgi:hypothetical protein
MWSLWRFLQLKLFRYLLLFALSAGIGFLCKYFVVLLPLSAFILMAHREYRRTLLDFRPYLFFIVFLLCTFPVLYWNMAYGFPSFTYHLVSRHGGAGFSLTNLGKLIGGQLGYLTPPLFMLFFWRVPVLWKDAYQRALPSSRFLLWTALPTLVFFSLVTIWTPRAEPHWPAMGFIPLLMSLAGHVAGMPPLYKWSRGQKIWRRVTIWFSLVGMGILMLHVSTSIFVNLMPEKYYNRKIDITNELYGWPQVRDYIVESQKISRFKAEFAFGYHYTICGQLSFALAEIMPVTCIHHRTDAFDFFENPAKPGMTGIYVGDNRYNEDPKKLYLCDNWIELPNLDIIRGKKNVRSYMFYLCRNYQGLQEIKKP